MVNSVGIPEAPQKNTFQCPAVKVSLNVTFMIEFTGSHREVFVCGIAVHEVCTLMEPKKCIFGNLI